MKNIIVCCDGTGNEYGTNNTNVVTAYALAEESAQQCRYYDPGIGQWHSFWRSRRRLFLSLS